MEGGQEVNLGYKDKSSDDNEIVLFSTDLTVNNSESVRQPQLLFLVSTLRRKTEPELDI